MNESGEFLTSVNSAYLLMIQDVLEFGDNREPRGKKTREIINHSCNIDMNFPVLSLTERHLNYQFMCAEAHWIISGDDRVESIEKYNKKFVEYSDDGVTFYGAYGPMVRKQLAHVISKLVRDRDTRQAVMTTWKPNPPQHTKDVPCTISDQFLIRDNRLHVIHNMRSSDIWLGVPYDIFSFSMLAAYICIDLRDTYPDLQLGNMYFNAGSRHLYDTHFETAATLLSKPAAYVYHPIDLERYERPDDLLRHLELLKDKRFDELRHPFLSEIQTWKKDKRPVEFQSKV